MRRVFITGASDGHRRGAGAALRRRRHRDRPVCPPSRPARAAGGQPARPQRDLCLRLTDTAALAAAAADFIARFGVPDLVIANAGISVGTQGEDVADIEKLRRVLDVNVAGLAATLAAFAPAMRARGRRHALRHRQRGRLPRPAGRRRLQRLQGCGDHLARILRTELAGSGVAVVTICPGYIDTPMTQVNRYRMPFLISAEDAAQRFARAIAAKRRLAVIPWQMAIVSTLLRALPGWLYDRLAARAPRKPRNLPL